MSENILSWSWFEYESCFYVDIYMYHGRDLFAYISFMFFVQAGDFCDVLFVLADIAMCWSSISIRQ